jgi:hypothetical protein
MHGRSLNGVSSLVSHAMQTNLSDGQRVDVNTLILVVYKTASLLIILHA